LAGRKGDGMTGRKEAAGWQVGREKEWQVGRLEVSR